MYTIDSTKPLGASYCIPLVMYKSLGLGLDPCLSDSVSHVP